MASPTRAGAGDVEDRELRSGGCLLVGLPGEHLAVAGGDLAFGGDGQGGVVDTAVGGAFEDGPRDQPQTRLDREGTDPVGERAGHGDGGPVHPVRGGGAQQRAFGGEEQFGDRDELHVREQLAGGADLRGEPLPAGFEVVRYGGGLQGGDGECAHGRISPR